MRCLPAVLAPVGVGCKCLCYVSVALLMDGQADNCVDYDIIGSIGHNHGVLHCCLLAVFGRGECSLRVGRCSRRSSVEGRHAYQLDSMRQRFTGERQ